MLGFYVICRQWQGRQWQDNCIFVTMAGQTMASKHFLYFFKFCKHWAAATVLIVVPNALYLLVVYEKLFNDTNKYVDNFPT